jgi:hypothetical protein
MKLGTGVMITQSSTFSQRQQEFRDSNAKADDISGINTTYTQIDGKLVFTLLEALGHAHI